MDDLLKLARQFDENMQQDRESSAELNAVNNSLNQCGNTSKTKLTDTWYPGNVKDLKCPSSSDQVEAELHALFDSSTQKVSGRLSQGSSASACSQEVKGQPATSASAEPRQSVLEPADKSGPAEEKGSCRLNANICDEFDDDWENDDLLNDSFVLEMTQNPIQQRDTDTKTTLQSDTKTNPSVCKPTANTNSAHQPSNLHWKPSHSALQELCPKPKATNRSTFKLEPNPHFQPKMAAKEASKSSFTVIHPKPQTSERKSTTTKTPSAPQTDKITTDQKEICVAADPVKDITDSLWDDDDDELLYQVCDSVERISNSQPQQASPDNCQEKDTAEDRQRQTTTPLPIDTAWSMNRASAKRQSPCAFVRSNSLPGTSCEAVNYRGWNVPMKGANNQSRMSQSLPGSHMSLGAFSQRRDSSGTFRAGNPNVDMEPHTVTAGAPQKFKSQNTAFKRNVSDSAVIGNKGKLSECRYFQCFPQSSPVSVAAACRTGSSSFPCSSVLIGGSQIDFERLIPSSAVSMNVLMLCLLNQRKQFGFVLLLYLLALIFAGADK